jgi:hypothetical protein
VRELVRDLKVIEHAEQSGRSTTVQARRPRWDGCLGMPSRFARVAAFFWALVERRFPQRSRIRVSSTRSVLRSPESRGVFFESPSGTNQCRFARPDDAIVPTRSTQRPASEFLIFREGKCRFANCVPRSLCNFCATSLNRNLQLSPKRAG